ncbi:6-phosphofructokinase [Taibaiella koreensis]|uniref:6-phosphofructokinase n=1 Tax=Taibaiella koreensis TaxID=1268548 RepID=UPI000E59C8E3|nr:6-phosphofructokinase [Taibaiella koreensis]
MKKLALLTSGGDAPGMNAAIRAVARTALYNGLEIFGIRRGYQGMIDGDIFKMETTSVSNIIQRGGTILKTARSKEFLTLEGREKAYRQLKQHDIDGLVLIGGDGTFKGANVFFKEYSLPAVGIPGTIDNDIAGTDYTLGFDTAVNTAVEAIDKIRDTAEAHDRIFIVEVMGRDAGYIALNSGIACGAEDILVPEQASDINVILERIGNDKRRKKLVNIIVVAEGDDFGGADALRIKIMEHLPELDVRSTILGHIQRGGSPSYFDRVQASRMGYAAVNALVSGQTQVMVGLENQEIIYTSFDHAIKQHAPLDMKMLEMAKILAS